MKSAKRPPTRSSKPSARAADALVRRHLRLAVAASLARKAGDPVVLDLRLQAGFADYFFICHATNPRQMEAIAAAVEEQLAGHYRLQPAHREGGDGAEWLVLDYLDFIVHIFTARSRAFYNLERLWAKAPRLALPTAEVL